MNLSLNYLLLPFMASLLVIAQACWGSFVKNTKPFHGTATQIFVRFLTSPRIWSGAVLYVLALSVYFLMLSKFKFFVVQTVMAALAITFSCVLSVVLFHEKLSVLNILGIILIVAGITLTVSTTSRL
jgi:multidrug transporter EmrE-like cation transporter